MPRINLLPWREQERKVRRREFGVAAGGAVFAAVVFACGGKARLLELDRCAEREEQSPEEGDRQARRRRSPTSRISRTASSAWSRAWKSSRSCSASGPRSCISSTSWCSTVPDGVYLTAIKQTGNKLEIHGVAQSSTRVSTFMRNIDSSTWMDNPELQVVETAKDSPTGGSNFTLFSDTVGVNLEHGGETTVKKVAAK